MDYWIKSWIKGNKYHCADYLSSLWASCCLGASSSWQGHLQRNVVDWLIGWLVSIVFDLSQSMSCRTLKLVTGNFGSRFSKTAQTMTSLTCLSSSSPTLRRKNVCCRSVQVSKWWLSEKAEDQKYFESQALPKGLWLMIESKWFPNEASSDVKKLPGGFTYPGWLVSPVKIFFFVSAIRNRLSSETSGSTYRWLSVIGSPTVDWALKR